MRDGRRPTLRDVAARAGVSFKTVSRVVNDEPGVSDALQGRVREAIDELGFRPNEGARLLRRPQVTRTTTVGVLLDDVADPFGATVLRAVEDAVRARGAIVCAASHDDDPDRERAAAAALLARDLDGLIVLPAGDDQRHLAVADRAGTAVVCVDRAPGDVLVDTVAATHAAAAATAVGHLVAAGHTHITYLGGRPAVDVARRRLAGFRDGIAGAGLDPEHVWEVADLAGPADAERLVEELFRGFDAPPTALVTAGAGVTVAAVRALHRLGRQRLVAVVGIDDFPTADLLSPAVTVVAQDPAAIGRRAAGLLLARMGGDAGPPGMHTVPTVLIPRGSGELRSFEH